MSALAEVGREIPSSLDSALILERIAERARSCCWRKQLCI
jgi:hypothetical protein